MNETSLDLRSKFLDWLKYKSEWYQNVLSVASNEDAKGFIELKLVELDRDIAYWERLTVVYENQDQYHLFVRGLPGEPSFTLLARDRSAPSMVRQWAFEREREIKNGTKPKGDIVQIENARKIATEMERWREDNEGEWRK